MIKINVEKNEYNISMLVVSEPLADALATEVCKQCQALQEAREKIEENGSPADPFSEEERNQVDAISFILDSVSAYRWTEWGKFMDLLKKETDYQSSTSGTIINMQPFTVKNAEFINRRYVQQVATKLRQASVTEK